MSGPRLHKVHNASDFDWSINEILQHLHRGNCHADLPMRAESLSMRRKRAREAEEHARQQGQVLLHTWWAFCTEMAQRWQPEAPWKPVDVRGRSMCARSAMSARLAETWGYSQAIYDTLGIVRQNKDSWIQAICADGYRYFEYTYRTRLWIQKRPTRPGPYVQLTAPASTAIWTFGEASTEASRPSSAIATGLGSTLPPTRAPVPGGWSPSP